ncbi:MAG: ATP-binding protein [Thermoanaerobaculia bacterium]
MRITSRIAVRVMLFNVLLVFLPIAGILYLGIYEDRLVERRMRSLEEQAALLAAALSGGDWVDGARARGMFVRVPDEEEEWSRLRVILPTGVVIADSRPRPLEDLDAIRDEERIREDWLYRIASSVGRPLLRVLRGDDPELHYGDPFEGRQLLRGPEITTVLEGEPVRSRRVSADQQSVTLYAAAPIRGRRGIIGAVLASDTTRGILRDLYTIRLGILRIFAASLLVAIVVTLVLGTTVVRPIRVLRREALEITERSEHLARRFSGSERTDEIGDLARALERLTRRLEAHVRFLETFATDVSHEFKNPLASIRSATEMLAEVDDPGERRRFLRLVENDIARMEHLLAGVREITTIDAKMPEEARAAVDVDSLAGKVVDGFRRRYRNRLAFEIAAEGPPRIVMASEERLMQVLENLLENAASFSPEKGTIRVLLRTDGSTALLRVEDEGPGIPEEHRVRIFDRFFTWRPDRPREGHTGLGLAIVRAIVDAYGGEIAAENRPEGGAAFELRLPRA